MPEDKQKMPSGFLVANHGKGFRAVRELQRADLWEAACYFAYPPTSTPGIYTHYRGLFLSSTPLSGSGEHVKEFPVPAAELPIRGQRLCYHPARQFGCLIRPVLSSSDPLVMISVTD